MNAISHVYDLPGTSAIDCTIQGRIALPGVVMELHHYRFCGPQGAVFSSPRSFLDLALTPRPGQPRGEFGAAAGAPARALGPIIFIPAGANLHTCWGEGEQTSVCCGFDGSGLDAENMALTGHMLEAALDVRSQAVGQALRRIAEEIALPGFCSEMLAQAIWTQATIELDRYLHGATAPESYAVAGLSRAQIKRIDECVRQPGKPPAVAVLAAECGLSTRHFFRLFKATTGQTLTGYVTDRKIERARQLLRPGGPPIKVIAWECGFQSAAAFSAAFRKVEGLTPRQFREALAH